MNDVLARLLQQARAQFARGTTTDTRKALTQARQVDRAGEMDAAFWVCFEVACLFRDNQSTAGEQMLRHGPKLTDANWKDLEQLLASAPENKFPAFAAVRRQLRSRVAPHPRLDAPRELDPPPSVSPDPGSRPRTVRSGANSELIAMIAADLINGKSKTNVVLGLVAQGWTPDDAAGIVDDAAYTVGNDGGSPQVRRSVAKSHLRHMLFGLLWIAVGIGAIYWDTQYNTAAATAEAAASRDSLVKWVGYISTAWGAIDFFRGLFGWIKYSD